MSQTQLFSMLLVTLALGITGGLSLSRGEYGLGALMVGIPLVGWLSVWLGQ